MKEEVTKNERLKPWEISAERASAYTDTFNARALAARHHPRLRYATERRAWHGYDGTRWRRDDSGDVAVRAAIDTADNFFRVAIEVGKSHGTEARDRFLQHAQKSEQARSIEAMVRIARTLLAVPVAKLDVDPFLLNTPTGTVDLRTGELRPHNPADLITKITGASFVPSAAARSVRGIRRARPARPGMRGFLQELAGYWATGVIREQILAFLQGGGANGKSTFVGLMARGLGDYAITGAPDLLMAKIGEAHPTELADLEGRRLVLCHETEKGRALAEARVKQLTGGDTVRARGMNENFREFRPTAKLVLLSNPKPRIRGTDDGIRRRIKLIPWSVRIPDAEQNPDFGEELWQAESSGILNWIVEGAVRWNAKGLTYPHNVGDASRDYFAEQDILGEFIADKCELAPDAWTSTGELFNAYRMWCVERNENPGEQRAFSDDLGERPRITRKRGAKGRGFTGISLRGRTQLVAVKEAS